VNIKTNTTPITDQNKKVIHDIVNPIVITIIKISQKITPIKLNKKINQYIIFSTTNSRYFIYNIL